MATSFTLNGVAKDASGAALAGCLVTLQLVADAAGGRIGILDDTATIGTEASTTSDGSGNYSFTGVVYSDLIIPPNTFYAVVVRPVSARPVATFLFVPSSAPTTINAADDAYQVAAPVPPNWIAAYKGAKGDTGPAGAAGTNGTNGIGYPDRGVWSSSGVYAVQDTVSRTVGGTTNVYVCQMAVGPSATAPESDPTHWRVWVSGGTNSLPAGGAALQLLGKNSATNYDVGYFTVNGNQFSLASDFAVADPLDVPIGSFTIPAAEAASVQLDIDAVLYANGAGISGIEVLWSQSVTSGNLFNGVVNGTVSGAHRTRVHGGVAGAGQPGGILPNPSAGMLGFGGVRNHVTLTGLTVGQPIYCQLIPVLIDSGNTPWPLAATGTFVCVSPSGRRAYVLAGADVIAVELGRSPENWKDMPYQPALGGFPVRAFVTSDGKKLWTTGLAVGAMQIFDTGKMTCPSANPITNSIAPSGMAPYGACQDPTGTLTVDIPTFGGAYTISGTPDVTTFAPAFKPAAVGKTLESLGLGAAFPSGTKVASYVNSQHIVMDHNATVTVGFGNIASYTPAVLGGIAYVCDQGTGHNRIQLFDVYAETAGTTYSLTSPYVPYTCAISPDGTKLAVYCKNSTSNYRLVILNAQTGSVILDIDTGNNSGVLPDPVWEDDSLHGWLACYGTNKLRRFNTTTGFDTAYDTTFSQPNALAISPTGKTLFVAGGNASASTWAYFMIDPLPSPASNLVQYDGNAAYGALTFITLGPDMFIYAVGTNGYFDAVKGGTVGCLASSSPGSYHLDVLVSGAH